MSSPINPNKPPQEGMIVPKQEIQKSEATDKITKASSKLSDFRAKKKSVNVFYASSEELSKSSFKNTMENIKHSVAGFFHRPSRAHLFMGFDREAKKDAFLKSIEEKESKFGKSLKDYIATLEAELKEITEDDFDFEVDKYSRAADIKKELKILKGENEKLDKIITNEEKELKFSEQNKTKGEISLHITALLNTQKVINDAVREKQFKYFQQEKEKAVEKLDALTSELEKIEAQITLLLPADWDADTVSKREKTALNQMSHFLKKAKLSDDLIH